MLRARLVTRRVPAPTATARASAFRARAPHRRGGAPGLTVQAASPCAARGARDAAATVLPHGVPTLPRRPVPRGTPGRDPLYNPTRRHAAARAVCRRSSESYRFRHRREKVQPARSPGCRCPGDAAPCPSLRGLRNAGDGGRTGELLFAALRRCAAAKLEFPPTPCTIRRKPMCPETRRVGAMSSVHGRPATVSGGIGQLSNQVPTHMCQPIHKTGDFCGTHKRIC